MCGACSCIVNTEDLNGGLWPHGYRAGVSLKLKGILVTLLVYDCGFQIELRRAF